MDFSTIVGLLMFAAVILTVTFKVIPLTVSYGLIPIIAALVMGYSPVEIVDLVSGTMVSNMTGSAMLLFFSIPFFTILSEAGMFDVIVDKILKLAKGNPLVIYYATILVAVVSMLDGSLITTYAITIPALLPLYKKLGLDRRFLLLLCAWTTMFMFMPWGSVPVLMASTAGIDIFESVYHCLPAIFFGAAMTFAIATFQGLKDRKRLGNMSTDDLVAARAAEANPMNRPKLFWVDLLLFILLLAILTFVRSIPAYIVFLVFTLVALTINYPNADDVKKIFNKAAPTFYNYVIIVMSISVLIGVFTKTPVMDGFVNLVITLIPGGLARYTHIIFALLAVPVFRFIPYQVYISLFPFMVAVGAQYGVSAQSVMAPFMVGLCFGTGCSPMVAQTYLGLSLCELDLDDYMKYAFWKCWIGSIIMVIFGVAVGLYF